MKIYTKRGDAGETDLFGGARVSKDDLQVEAYGAVDELNACVGVAVATSEQLEVRAVLARVQHVLFDVGSVLAAVPAAREKGSVGQGASGADVEALEAAIDAAESELPELKSFILPGGSSAAAALHVARTVCRRAERRMVASHRDSPLAEPNLRYVNRLSDLLFVFARLENRRAGVGDVEWHLDRC